MTNLSVQTAKISLLSCSDSNCIWFGATDSLGKFKIQSIPKGVYILRFEYEGAEEFQFEKLDISNDSIKVDLGHINLITTSQTFTKTTVKAKKTMIVHDAGKVTYIVENNITLTNTTVFETLERLPGVAIDRDGNLSIRGRKGVLILIDGKSIGMSGQALINLLKSTPSGNIQKIEVIPGPSANYDATGTAGIINILFKKNKQEGLNGSINSGVLQGRYTKANSGINISYKQKKVNLNANYSYSELTGFTNLLLNRKFYTSDSLTEEYRSNDYLKDRSKTHFSRINGDIDLPKNTILSFSGLLQFNKHMSHGDGKTDVLTARKEDNYFTNFLNTSHFIRNNYSLGGEMKRNIDTNGRTLIVNLDYLKYHEKVIQKLNTTYNLNDGKLFKTKMSDANQVIANERLIAKIDYIYPLVPGIKFEAGVKSNIGVAGSNIQISNIMNTSNGIESINRTIFQYKENISAAYINYTAKFDVLTIQAGLRGEGTNSKGILEQNTVFKRNYYQVFPSISSDYKLSKNSSLILHIGRRIERPSYDQMNPYKRMLNPTTYLEGNPFLLPQTSYNFELGFSYKNSIFCSFSHSRIKNNIAEVLIQDTFLKMTYQSIINLERFNSTGLDFAFSKKINKWLITNSSLQLINSIYRGSIHNTAINNRFPSFNVNLSNTVSLSKSLTMECSFLYYYKSFYGVTIIQPKNNFSLGIQKSVIKRHGIITLNFTDIFWHSYARGISEQNGVTEIWSAKRDTRMVKLSFSYKFGQKRIHS